eukprot:TRINITY_DN10672_c0_g1_i1.p1 TRINITY_DN10672_c0_g1~~TRINITY_DN10672_c0_g1_i1.p1  ORF type:complete len:295 (-),score=53.61 TRINITY_DN10672_c0_g1_i1:68-850(-)
MAKTRQQLQITYSQNFFQVFKTIIDEGGGGIGGYLRIYRGVLSPVIGMIPKSAVWLATNERLKYWFMGEDGKETTKVRLLAGFFSGWPEACVVAPFDSVKIKLQSRRFAHQYKNSWDCAKGTVQTEGITGLFRGLEATLWRNGTWNAMYFAMIGLIKDRYVTNNSDQDKSRISKMLTSFSYGLAAGLVATTINTPLDLVKSRIQLGVHDKYRWALPTLVTIAKEEGVGRLWRGLPLRLLRMGLGGGVTICVYESMMSLFK